MGRATSGPENAVCSSWASAPASPCQTCSSCGAAEQPEHAATLSSFSLDTFEVTVGRFRKFVGGYPGSKPGAGAGANPNVPGSGWNATWDSSLPADQAALVASVNCSPASQTWTNTVGSNENMPISCTNWFLAFAFCAWDRGRLATEAEWEYAASGGENRPLPWTTDSSAPDSGHAVYNTSAAANVGSRAAGVGKWGHHDLSGNLWEWVLDWYASYSSSTCSDCAAVVTGSDRVARGGYWGTVFVYGGEGDLRAALRNHAPPAIAGDAGLGFRCARNP